MVDRENFLMVASWDTAQMTDLEVQSCCDDYAHILRQLTDVENWDKALVAVLK